MPSVTRSLDFGVGAAGRRLGDLVGHLVPVVVLDALDPAAAVGADVPAGARRQRERDHVDPRAGPRGPARVLLVDPLGRVAERLDGLRPHLDVHAAALELDDVALVLARVPLGGGLHARGIELGEVGGAGRRDLRDQLRLDVLDGAERRRVGRGLRLGGEDRRAPDLEEEHAEREQRQHHHHQQRNDLAILAPQMHGSGMYSGPLPRSWVPGPILEPGPGLIFALGPSRGQPAAPIFGAGGQTRPPFRI